MRREHGFGSPRRPGVNTNILADGDAYDPISGNAVLNGIPVTVSSGSMPTG